MVMSCADSLRGPLHLYSSYLTSSGAFLTAAPTIVEACAVGEEIQHKNRKAHKTEKNRTVRQEKYECHASREMFKVRRESCPAVQSERLLLSAGALPKDRVRFPPSPAQQTCLWSLWVAVSLYQFQYRVAPGMGKRFSWNEGGGCAVRWARSCGSTACCRCWVLMAQAAGKPLRSPALQALPCRRWAACMQLAGRAGAGARCGMQRVTLLKLHRRQSPGTPQVISSECCLKRLSHGFANVLWPEDVFLTSKGSSGWLSASQAESTIPLCSWCVLTMCDFFGMRCFLKAALTCVQMKLALKLVNTNLSCGQFPSEPDKWVVSVCLCVFVSS